MTTEPDRTSSTGRSPTGSAVLDYPFAREQPLRPPAKLIELQRQPGLPLIRMWDGTIARLVTRQEDARAVLNSPYANSDNSRPGYPAIVPHRKRRPDQTGPDFQPLLTDMAGADHIRLRRVVASELSVKRVRAMEPAITAIIDRSLDQLESHGPPADLSDVVLKGIPSELIGGMLGFPAPERPQWRAWFETWVAPGTPEAVRRETHGTMLAYVDERIARSEREPGDDFISRLIVAQRSGEIARKEVVMLIFLMYAAGFDTTANSMAFGVLELLTNPDQKVRMLQPGANWRPAVEEMLRVSTIIHYGVARVADGGPIDTPSGRIEDGEGVVINILAANFDPDVFEDPWRFDVGRDAREQLGFAFGAHQCVGQQLARVELIAVMPRLFGRFPGLRLAVDVSELTLLENGTRVVESLPVTW